MRSQWVSSYASRTTEVSDVLHRQEGYCIILLHIIVALHYKPMDEIKGRKYLSFIDTKNIQLSKDKIHL